jgi:drug/metabolite transporter (DMT)-like permease
MGNDPKNHILFKTVYNYLIKIIEYSGGSWLIMHKIKGHIAVLVGNIIFGLNIPATKALLEHWMTPVGIMASRALVALVIFWTVSLFVQKERVARGDFALMALAGVLGFVLSQFATAEGLEYTTPVHFALIIALSPVIVMLLAALFLGEPISRQKVLGVALGVAGAGILVIDSIGSSGSANLLGIALAFASVVTWAVYLIILRTITQKYSVVTQMKWIFLFACVILLPLGVRAESDQVLFSGAWAWDGVMELGFVLVFATAIGYFLTPYAMKFLRATTVSVYMNLQPVVASVAAIWVGQDIFSWDKPLSALLVIAGALIVARSPAKGD